MKTIIFIIMIYALFGVVSSARSEDSLSRISGMEGISRAIPDKELGNLRGKGFGGLAVRIVFDAFVDNEGSVKSKLDVEEGNPEGSPSSTVGNGSADAKLLAQIGEFKNANGVFQITQVPGSGNTVTNNLFIQIAIINVLSGTEPVNVSAPALASGLFGGP